VVSPEIVNVVEAETVPVVEGRVCTVVMQDGNAPPGSWTKVVVGTQEAQPGPLHWSATGA
jgi:hypothetical protein